MRASVLLVALLAPVLAAAQSVSGVVIERSSGAPIGGVVVLLLDAADNPVARALSGDRGAYRLAAPGAGAYRIRTLRIGYRPSTTDALELGAGREVSRDVDVAAIPFLLDTVKTTGRNACRERTGTDVASYVWDQARTALYSTQISSKLPAIGATLTVYERAYNPGSTRVREQQTATKSGFTTAPWKALSADSLRRVGYVIEDDDGWTTFYSPDVDVLLSRTFQADHCFRLTRSRGDSLVGVIFEPNRDRAKVTDIKGTIWLDSKSAQLRRVEFRYTNVSPVQEDEGAGGQIEFARMKNGGFAISRWNIRMPVIALRDVRTSAGLGTSSGPQQRLAELRVAGGELQAVTLAGDTLWTRPGLVVAGVITDSTSGGGVPEARISLAGTALRATSDARGRFMIPDVLPGEYTLEVRTASLDSMNAIHSASLVVDSEAKPLTVRVARGADLAKSLCSFDKSWSRASPPGIILGTSRLISDSVPPSNVLVAAEWVQMELATEGGVATARGVRRWKETRTNSKGEFRLCGVPTGTAILVRASGDSAEAPPIEVKIADGQRFERTELVFDHVVARSAVFAGTVFVDSTQQPIPDVEISLPGLKRSMLTNDQGRFRFADVPAGEHQVMAKRIGYGPLDTKLTFAPGQSQSRRIFLTKVPILDVVEVNASRLPPEFEENRRLGLGHFLTRAELAKLEHVSTAAVLEQMRGLKITSVLPIPGAGGNYTSARYVSTNRVIRTDQGPTPTNPFGIMFGCPSTVYLDRMIVSRQGNPPFDINSIKVDQIEAIQWYANKMQLPSEYNLADNKCGALVIHTRKSP